MGSQQQEVHLVVPQEGDIAAIPYGEPREDLPVLVSVVAPSNTGHVPIDLVVVVDVSLSMNFKTNNPKWPTRLSMANAVTQFVMNNLHEDDRMAIVPFCGHVAGATALTTVNKKGRLALFNKVMNLKVCSDTKFMPALDCAWSILDTRKHDDKEHRPGFVFFLSDGEDNGVLSTGSPPKPLFRLEYPVHTFSMCASSDPRSMVYIANQTGGVYHAINDSMSNLVSAVRTFLAGITSVVAIDTSVHLAVPEESVVRIKSVESVQGKPANDGKSMELPIGAMYANQEKKFIVHLTIPSSSVPTTPAAEGEEIALEVSGGYFEPTQRKRHNMEPKQVKIKRTDHASSSVSSTGAVTPSPTQLPQTPYNQQLVVEIVRVVVVNIVKVVVHRYTGYNNLASYLQTEWNNFTSETTTMTTTVSRELLAAWNLVKGTADGKLAITNHAQADINTLTSTLTKDSSYGMHYVHSWLQGHQAQQVMATSAFFQQSYLADMTHELEAMALSTTTGVDTDPCKCVDFDLIEKRLEVWSRIKTELPQLFKRRPEDDESHHLTEVFELASREAISRAMHHDMYLAVVHASTMKRCYCTGKQPPSAVDLTKPSGSSSTQGDGDHHHMHA